MIKQINMLLFFIIFPGTLWCENNYKIHGEQFRVTNYTGYTLDAIVNTVDNRPHSIVLRCLGYFKFIKIHNILGKKITVYSSKNKLNDNINLYYKKIPIHAKTRIFE